MEHTINKLSDSQQEIEISLEQDEIKDDIAKEVAKRSKDIQIPGFRKGKAPKSVIKKMYGDALEYDAAEKVANKKFWDTLRELQINPVGEPTMTDLQFEPGEKLSVKVQYEVVPKLEVDNYKGLEVEVPDLKASDKEVDAEVNRMLDSQAEFEDAEKVEDESYTITCELVKLDDAGNPLEDTRSEGLDIDLSNPQVNKEIKDNTIRKGKGDEFEFTFEDPKAEGDEPKSFTYQGKITAVKKKKQPELNEEFIKKMTKDRFSTEEELRKGIEEEMKRYFDQNVDNLIFMKLQGEIMEANDFTPPTALVNNYLDHVVKGEIEKAKKEHKKVPSENELREQMQKQALATVKWLLVRDAIIEKEDISLPEERLKQLAEENAEKMGVTPEVLMQYYQSPEIQQNLMGQEFNEFLKKNNTVKRIDPEEYDKKYNRKEDEKDEG